jgi:hypothetical protein
MPLPTKYPPGNLSGTAALYQISVMVGKCFAYEVYGSSWHVQMGATVNAGACGVQYKVVVLKGLSQHRELPAQQYKQGIFSITDAHVNHSP